ncbi:MAG TPA: DPP IV N-terminal domain-containing protein, partial [Terriglobales bacterium]
MKTASFNPVFWFCALSLSCSLFAQQADVPAPPSIQGQNAPATTLTIPGIFAEGGITGRAPESVAWSPDGSRVSYVLRDDSGEHGQLWYVDLQTGTPAVLVASEKLASLVPPDATVGKQAAKDDREKERRTRYSVADYHWAPDSGHLLFESKGQLWLYRLSNGTAIQLTSSSDPLGDPKFSPDGSHISYIRKHNLYVRPVNGDREAPLTSSKDKDDNILNGEVDWVYAEELDVRSNYFWSPDGKHIAYLQMNETAVPEYPITDFIPLHPTVDKQKYPKAGDPNPEVRIGVVEASSGHQRWIKLSPELEKDKDYYIPRFGWINKNLLYAQVLNRAQNQLDLYVIELESGRSQLVLSEKSDAWVEVNDNFRVLKSGDRFLWSSWRDGHTHLYLYSFSPGSPLNGAAKLERQLTKGDFEVFSLNAVDESSGTVYFTANKDDARQRQLYAVKLDGGDLRKISQEEGTHQVTFSENGAHYVDNFSALVVPPQLSLCAAGQEGCKSFWHSRDLAALHLIKPQFVDFTAEDGTVLQAEI